MTQTRCAGRGLGKPGLNLAEGCKVMNLKKSWQIFKGTFAEFGEDNVLRLSAALSYYSIFSLGPLLVIAVGVAGLAFGHEGVRHTMESQLTSVLGEKAAQTV